MQDTEATRVTLSELKQLGVRLAIDDFGTGYSSLSYLRLFPINVLKIDRSFVASMTTGPDQVALVRSILKLSETLHLETVAEGIEEAGQLADLQTLGADLGQGFFFAKTISPAAISALLATRRGHIDGASVEQMWREALQRRAWGRPEAALVGRSHPEPRQAVAQPCVISLRSLSASRP